MALYAIGDLHLSFGADKPMDVFGGGWENYIEKIERGFSVLEHDDVCVLCGDLSWGMSMEESVPDFRFISSLPGRKIVLKGNHDYWWTTASKAYKCFEANGIERVDILNNNCYYYGEMAICGTRGWFCEEETGSVHDKKIMARELMRLEASLKAAGSREKLCFLHYPPMYKDYVCGEIIAMLRSYDVRTCCYGHIHGRGHAAAIEGERDGVTYNMVSADYLKFAPLKIMD